MANEVEDQVTALMAADPGPGQEHEHAPGESLGGAMVQPTPWTIGVGKADLNGAPIIVLEIHKVTGTDVLYCPPDFAKTIAAMLTEAATGLTVPVAGSGLIVPGR